MGSGSGERGVHAIYLLVMPQPAFPRGQQVAHPTLLLARKAAGMTQAQVARAMGTQQASIARLESGLARGQLPSLSMLKRYADALGRKLHIRLAA